MNTVVATASGNGHRCCMCSHDHELYIGDSPSEKVVIVEVFHKYRGACLFGVCNSCSLAIVAAWAKSRKELIDTTKAAEVPVTPCDGCSTPIAGGRYCSRCEASRG